MPRRVLVLCVVLAALAACLGCQTSDSARASVDRLFGNRGNFFTMPGEDLVP
jgi:hypothetical protein